jgi:hypothetical protein
VTRGSRKTLQPLQEHLQERLRERERELLEEELRFRLAAAWWADFDLQTAVARRNEDS